MPFLTAPDRLQDGDFLPITLTAAPHAERRQQSVWCRTLKKSMERASQTGPNGSSSSMHHQAPGISEPANQHQRKPSDVGSVASLGSTCSLDNWIARASTSPNDSPEMRKSKISRAWRLLGMAGASLPRRKQRPTVLEAPTPPSTPVSSPATRSEAASASAFPHKEELPFDISEPCVASVEGWAALGSRCLTIAEDEVAGKNQPQEDDCRRKETPAISEGIDLSPVDDVPADNGGDSQPKPPSLTGTVAVTVDASPGSVPTTAETAMSRSSAEHSPRQQESEDAAPDGPLSDTESQAIKNINEAASLSPVPKTCPLLTSPDPEYTEGSGILRKSLLSAHVVTTHFEGIVRSLPQEEPTSSTPAAAEGEQSSSLYDTPVTSSCRALAEADSPCHYQQHAQPLHVQATCQPAEQSANPEVSADDLKLAFSNNNAAVQGDCDAWHVSDTVSLEEELMGRTAIQQQTPEDTDTFLQSRSQPSGSPASAAERPEPAACSRTGAVKTTSTIRLQSFRSRQVYSGKTPILPLPEESLEEREDSVANRVLLPSDSVAGNENRNTEEDSKGDSGQFKVGSSDSTVIEDLCIPSH